MIRSPNRTLDSSEDVSLFPGYGKPIDGGSRWRFEISGAIYDPKDVTLRKRILLRLLSRVMKIEKDWLQDPIFQERIRAFTASTERGKSVAIRIGDKVVPLQRKTRRNGHFAGSFLLSQDEIAKLTSLGHIVDDCLTYEIVTGADDTRLLQGRTFMLSASGMSVVSDIDDTIKETCVTSRRELVVNTFFREFRCVDDIASVYQQWADSGAAFHYVSSSPWQLLKPLDELFTTLALPSGSMHLRNSVLRDQMLQRMLLIRRKGKAVAIRKLLESFPQRKYVFVGDSREHDPETYAKLCHQFPGQISAIFIREWDDRPLDGERMEKIAHYCGETLCYSFRSAEELMELGEPVFGNACAVCS